MFRETAWGEETMRWGSLLLAAVTIGPIGVPFNGWAAGTGENIVLQGVPGKVPACATCHGPRGEGGREGIFPRLAGQPAAYVEAQLKAFRDGGRSSPFMSPTVTGLSDADISAVANFL